MTPEQIQNWRRVLCTMIGPYALLMPEHEIISMRDILQAKVNNMKESDCENNETES